MKELLGNQMIECSVCNKISASVRYSSVKSVYSKKAYDIMSCSNCGHFFTDPTFTKSELDDIYKNKYSYDAHELIEKEKRMRAKRYAGYISRLENVSSALEVGCMHGLLLTELKKRELSVAGVELDPEAVKYCRDKGLNVAQSTIEEYLKGANHVHDVIVMSHVIEHIVDPKSQLVSLSKRMSKDGKLILITPNSRAFTRRLFTRYWGYWQVPVHVNHFNIESIRYLLNDSGFELIDKKFYGADSLFFLSTFANILGARNETKLLSSSKRLVVRIASAVLKYWYFIGTEDMVVVAIKK